MTSCTAIRVLSTMGFPFRTPAERTMYRQVSETELIVEWYGSPGGASTRNGVREWRSDYFRESRTDSLTESSQTVWASGKTDGAAHKWTGAPTDFRSPCVIGVS